MPKGIEITVRNMLIAETRDINVYNHSTRSAYMISYSNSITIPLGTVEEGDYLHISIVSGPGSMEKACWINLPSWCDFTVSGLGNGELTHSGDRILLTILPGPPLWQLKITRPKGPLVVPPSDQITMSDDGPGEAARK